MIKRILGYFSNSLTRKTTGIYFLSLIVPIIIIATVSWIFYKQSMEQQNKNMTQQILKQANLKLEAYIEELAKLTVVPYLSTDMLDFLSQDEYLRSQVLKNENNVQAKDSAFFSLIQSSKDVLGYFLFSSDGRVFYQTKYITSMLQQNYKTMPWYNKIESAGQNYAVIGLHQEEQMVDRPYVYSIARMLYSFNDNKPYGAVLVDINIDALSKIISSIELVKGSRILLLDEKNIIIQDTNNPQSIGVKFSDMKISNSEYYIYKDSLKLCGWTMIGVVPVKAALAPVYALGYWILLLFLICILFGFILMRITTLHIVKPIIMLRSHVSKIEKGNFDINYSIKQKDEIGDLGNALNIMSREIKNLIKTVYVSEIKSKEAQILALESQINPHFLFNVLESVKMRAELGDNSSISTMVSALSKLMRISLRDSAQEITLGEELERIENYLTIEKLNYKERLQVYINVDDKLKKLKVLKFIIQPILENAIKHGVEKQIIPTRIWINAKQNDCELIITVEDDGPSIQPDKFERIQYALAQKSSSLYGGIGLMNVHKRIKLYYGETYGVIILSREPSGVILELHLPVKKEKSHNDDNDC